MLEKETESRNIRSRINSKGNKESGRMCRAFQLGSCVDNCAICKDENTRENTSLGKGKPHIPLTHIDLKYMWAFKCR